MSKYTRLVLLEFRSAENKTYLTKFILAKHGGDHKVKDYLASNIDSLIMNFSNEYEYEMLNATPLTGVTIYDQLKSLNQQFIANQMTFIRDYLIGNEPEKYTLCDGGPDYSIPTSRKPAAHFHKPGNDILASWWYNSGRDMTARDDEQGDVNRSAFYGPRDNRVQRTGITVCDQSSINTSYAVESFYGDFGHKALNGPKLWGGAFGVPSAENDARLMTRRIFRSNEGGIENGIPHYEKRLYQRPYERQIEDSLRQGEKGNMLYGYDMGSLHRRVGQRRAYAAKHGKYDPSMHTDYANRYS